MMGVASEVIGPNPETKGVVIMQLTWWAGGLNSKSAFDIMDGVGRLFDRCVASLEKTRHLWKPAGRMQTKSAVNGAAGLSRLRDELDHSLAFAKKVDE